MNKKYHPISEIIVCHSCENRNPGFPVETGIQFLMVPCFRRDEFWIPAFAGMTTYAYFKHRIAQFRYKKVSNTLAL